MSEMLITRDDIPHTPESLYLFRPNLEYLAEDRPAVVVAMETEWPANELKSPFVDIELELEKPLDFMFSKSIALVMEDFMPTDEAERIAYVGYQYARTISAALLNRSPELSKSVLGPIPEYDDNFREAMKKKYQTGSADYLAARPTLADINQRFSRTVSPDVRYQILASVAFGITLYALNREH